MASKLLNQYGYSKDNVKVLLGGWNSWKANNAVDPKGYPIEAGAGGGAAPGSGNPPGVTIITPGGASTIGVTVAPNPPAQPTAGP